jgi:hypothetical protein
MWAAMRAFGLAMRAFGLAMRAFGLAMGANGRPWVPIAGHARA